MYCLNKIRKLAGPWFLDVVTRPQYRQLHPECRGGDDGFRHLAWHGDALLDLVVVEHLLAENGFTSDNARALGELNTRKEAFCSRKTLAYVAEKLELDRALRTHMDDLSSNWRAEAVEALISAIYKHSGEEAMRLFIKENIITPIEEAQLAGEVLTAVA